MAGSWDDVADGWDEHEAVRAYAAAAFDSLVAALSVREVSLNGLVVCDFGCGTGLLTQQLADVVASVDAVDSSASMLRILETKIAASGWTNVRPSADLPSVAVYDLVVCSSVCAFVDDYPGTVRQLADLLAPGGVFVQWDWERGADDPDGLSRDEIRAALTRASLDAVQVEVAFEVGFDGNVMRPLMGIGQRPQP